MLTYPWVEHQLPDLGHIEQIYGGVGRSISQLLLELHAPIFWKLLRHIGTFLHHLQGVTHLQSDCQNQAKLRKYMAEGEVNMSASIRAPCTKYFLEVS